jgi:hypothetical protein
MPAVTFFSNALCKSIGLDEVHTLTREQLDEFHAELLEVVEALDRTVTDAHVKAKASGIPADRNWLHRIGTKKRIALKFATEVKSRMEGGSTLQQRSEYDRIFKAKFRAVLEEEFGEAELVELEREVATAAKQEYKQWIAKTAQRMWYVP